MKNSKTGTKKTPIIVVVGPTGGCGKTTAIINLSSEFAAQKLNVLVIDLDPQNYAANHLGTFAVWNQTILEASQMLPINAVNTDFSGIDYIPSFNSSAKQLPKWLINYASSYDVVMIDCPPHFQNITKTALTLATHYMMLVDSENGYSVNNLTSLSQNIVGIATQSNPKLRYLGGLLNKVSLSKISSATQIRIANISNFPADPSGTPLSTLFPLGIQKSICIGEASVFKVPVKSIRRAASNAISQSYTMLANHLINCVPI